MTLGLGMHAYTDRLATNRQIWRLHAHEILDHPPRALSIRRVVWHIE